MDSVTSGRSFQCIDLRSVPTANSYLSAGACCQEPEKEEDEEREWGRENGGRKRKESKRENCSVTKSLKLSFNLSLIISWCSWRGRLLGELQLVKPQSSGCFRFAQCLGRA